jgi:predicted small secreted protein
MKKIVLPVILLFLCVSLSGCGLMEDAFKAGFIIALVLAAIVGLLIWIFHFSYKILAARFPAVRFFVQDFFRDED